MGRKFDPGDLDLDIQASDQTRSQDISYTNEKVTAPKTEPYATHCVR